MTVNTSDWGGVLARSDRKGEVVVWGRNSIRSRRAHLVFQPSTTSRPPTRPARPHSPALSRLVHSVSMSVLLRRTLPSVSSSRAVLSLASSSRLPMAPSLAGSTSSVLSLLSSLSLSTPPPSSLTPLGRRSFSTTTTLCTPRLGLLKRKHRQGAGWDPTKSQKAKTHKGAQERFRCYKTGLVSRLVLSRLKTLLLTGWCVDCDWVMSCWWCRSSSMYVDGWSLPVELASIVALTASIALACFVWSV